MPIFKIEKQKAQQLSLKRDGFGDEFKLRDFFADNLEEILGVRFLEKEYQIPGGRIDTLGIDENNSPVIIEYKWKENEDVLSQGLFYLDWLVKNKPHFKLLVKSKLGQKVEVNWDQPRVILIAQGFNRYIKSAVQRVDNVELKTYSLYDGNVLNLENESSPLPEKNYSEKKKPVDKPIVTAEYDLNYHLNVASPEMQKVFNTLRDLILKLPSVEEKVGQKSGITYRTTKSFTRLEFRKTWIQVLLRHPKYAEDKKGIVKDVSTFGWGFLGMVKFTPDTDINLLFTLIKASYNSTL
jgi:predicted transport protein